MRRSSLARCWCYTIAIEHALLHGIVGIGVGKVVWVRRLGAISGARVRAAGKIVCTPEGATSQLVFVFRVLASGAGKVETVAKGSSLTGGQVGDGNAVVVGRWSNTSRNGDVDGVGQLGRVDEVAYGQSDAVHRITPVTLLLTGWTI